MTFKSVQPTLEEYDKLPDYDDGLKKNGILEDITMMIVYLDKIRSLNKVEYA